MKNLKTILPRKWFRIVRGTIVTLCPSCEKDEWVWYLAESVNEMRTRRLGVLQSFKGFWK